MALMIDPELKQTIDQMVVSFQPVYQLWIGGQSDSQLPQKAEDCLAADITKLGGYMMAADSVARTLENKLLSEMIACLRTEYDHMPYDYELAATDTSLSDQLSKMETGMPDLLSKRVLQDWINQHHGNKAVANSTLKCLAALANRLVIRDGRLTSEELKRLSQLESHLQL
ncbi:MAG: hypothetical protein LW823_00355 [Rickettsiales bacterium]|jgi:hypothetical protein|nr:hypothetical protein [Rickettsiales bacterium]